MGILAGGCGSAYRAHVQKRARLVSSLLSKQARLVSSLLYGTRAMLFFFFFSVKKRTSRSLDISE